LQLSVGLLADLISLFKSKFVQSYKRMENVLDKKMFNYFTQLNEQEKKSVIQMLKAFLKGRAENENRISIEQYNKELDEAMEQIKKGEVYSHEEVVKTSYLISHT
jgi:hypothetical protein